MWWLVGLYPAAWRVRYESEMMALLEDYPITAATVLDLLLGAFIAHLHDAEFREGVWHMVERARSGIVLAFCAFMVVALGLAGLMRFGDPLATYQPAVVAHPAIGLLFTAVRGAGLLAFLAFLSGGLPLVVIAGRSAWKERRRASLRALVGAIGCGVIAAVATVALAWIHPSVGWGISYLALMAILWILGTVMVARLMTQTSFDVPHLWWAHYPLW